MCDRCRDRCPTMPANVSNKELSLVTTLSNKEWHPSGAAYTRVRAPNRESWHKTAGGGLFTCRPSAHPRPTQPSLCGRWPSHLNLDYLVNKESGRSRSVSNKEWGRSNSE
jgi:hypothetical protein